MEKHNDSTTATPQGAAATPPPFAVLPSDPPPTPQRDSIASRGEEEQVPTGSDDGLPKNFSKNPEKVRQALIAQLARWKTDIVAFARQALRIDPTEQQCEVLRAFARPGARIAVKAGHGTGKSTTMAICAIWHTLLFKPNKSVATAVSSSQLEDVLMAEIAKILGGAHPWVTEQMEVTKSKLVVKGAEAMMFLSARTARQEKPDALQGFHSENMAVFADEAFGISDNVFEAGRGALSTEGARILMMGNPTVTSGYVYNAFNRNKHLWTCFTMNAEKSPLVSKNSIQEWKDEYGDDSDEYRIRVLGEFPRAAICQLIPRALAESAGRRQLALHQYCFAPVVLGVDVAWEGDDRTVIYKRQGLAATELWQGRNVDNMTVGGLVNQFWTEHKPDAVFIDVGWGTGVIDYLRSLNRAPIPVNFGSASSSKEFKYKRTEMWCKMKKWLEEGGAIPYSSDLIDDLAGPNYSFTSSGEKLLEQKKLMKKRGLRSPDIADALALTFAETVVKKSELEEFEDKPYMAQTEYDIFE